MQGGEATPELGPGEALQRRVAGERLQRAQISLVGIARVGRPCRQMFPPGGEQRGIGAWRDSSSHAAPMALQGCGRKRAAATLASSASRVRYIVPMPA